MTAVSSVVPRASEECVIRSAPGDGAVAPRPEIWVLAATIFGSSLASIDGSAVNVALPRMQASLQATAADLQWVIEAYSLFLASLILVGGSLGDRLGRRRVFASGIVIFTVASVACGAAPNVGFLILARCVQGIGGAAVIPGSLAIISASFDPARRGKAIGTWSGFSAITTAIGPVLGGWVVQSASWRWVFFINVPVAAVTVFLLFSPPVKSALDAQRNRFVGATIPADVAPAEKAQLERVLKESFVSAFRASMLIAAALALVSALLAAWLIDARLPKQADDRVAEVAGSP